MVAAADPTAEAPADAAAPDAPPADTPAEVDRGLRARKKDATRRALIDAALRLFAERGFEQTTVEDIAAAVEVAPRTFHRYFPRKEDVLYVDAIRRIELLRVALAARPADEPVFVSLREAVVFALDDLADHRDREALRTRVLADNPVVKAANFRYLDEWSAVIAAHVAARAGCDVSDPWPALVARCVVGAVAVARATWIDRGGDLATLIADAFAMLARLGELAESTLEVAP
ncbi:MAG TPA: TetR family transcriptional regulator [Acidimicrobiales bacterium]